MNPVDGGQKTVDGKKTIPSTVYRSLSTAWGIAETPGMMSQVRALALALDAGLEIKPLPIGKPWDRLPNLAYATPLGSYIIRKTAGDAFHPPWPDLVISCGRRASMAALGLKRVIKNEATKFIHIHHPCVPMKCFDLIITVDHDNVNGANVIKTRFALHSVTEAALAEAKERFAAQFSAYPEPHVAVLLGGTTSHYEFTVEAMAQMVMALQRLLHATSGSLLITPSRRTGEKNIAMLRNVFPPLPPPVNGGGSGENPPRLRGGQRGGTSSRVYIYDESGDNPYMALLALAQTIVVTNDSINMMSEACATGKPVYILPLPGHSGTKQARFAEGLIKDGIARLWNGKLESWHYEKSNEMEKLAAEVKQRLTLP